MIKYQFEEIIFWLSFIAFLLVYQTDITWLKYIVGIISISQFIIVMKYSYKQAEKEKHKIILPKDLK